MKSNIKLLLATFIVSLSLIVPGLAGSYVEELINAAEQGDANSQIQLGAMYYLGQGVPQDYARAMAWYRKSAEQGNANAQYDLGLMYAEGKSIPQNYVEAHKWYSLAAAQGLRMAVEFRKDIIRKMTPVQIAEAQRLAREWKPKK